MSEKQREIPDLPEEAKDLIQRVLKDLGNLKGFMTVMLNRHPWVMNGDTEVSGDQVVDFTKDFVTLYRAANNEDLRRAIWSSTLSKRS